MARPKKEVENVQGGEKKEEFVTLEAFNALQSSVGQLVELLQKKNATPEEAKIEKEVDKASPDDSPMNPEWREKAKEIIGDAMERCELFYPKGGGAIFTVIIKNEHSNAPKEYLRVHKVDRRSKDIAHSGLEGVENWCKLIASNLKRKK